MKSLSSTPSKWVLLDVEVCECIEICLPGGVVFSREPPFSSEFKGNENLYNAYN